MTSHLSDRSPVLSGQSSSVVLTWRAAVFGQPL